MTDLFEADTATTTSLDLRRAQRDQRRRERRWRTLMATAVALVILSLGSSVGWSFVQAFRTQGPEVPDYDGYGQGSVEVVINPGDSGDVIAETLYQAGVVASAKAFRLAAYANPEDAQKIAPGYYVLPKQMKAEYALIALLDKDYKREVSITIPEGRGTEYILDKIAKVTGTSLTDVKLAAANTDAIGLPPEANGSLEGWLFPSTYKFNPGVQPTDVLSTMVSTTVAKLKAQGVPEDEWLKILTVASLVEKEAKLDVDRPKIAGVIYNRLKADQPLELDSTVKYAVGTVTDGEVFTSAEERKIDSPYNTYKVTGLPPGPIAAPGEASIEAAVNPDHNDYFFFVTVNLITGETKYAKTFAEHQKNVKELQAWIKKNKSS
jgi:UPF0755 protein